MLRFVCLSGCPSVTYDIGTITVSSWPGLTAGAAGEHLLVVMDSTELTDNLQAQSKKMQHFCLSSTQKFCVFLDYVHVLLGRWMGLLLGRWMDLLWGRQMSLLWGKW